MSRKVAHGARKSQERSAKRRNLKT
ncbi:hypothetical protein CCACVL1_16837 [Corchorus capsularis]|uniref:Uncharacterized protein n=1 Tax=Corchorus capsularis TaxID=210143 RepID=A0A1R3HVE2_COCAP|nr:hypothetical protein CCACVL1_16837 [Corchorus capsularis]